MHDLPIIPNAGCCCKPATSHCSIADKYNTKHYLLRNCSTLVQYLHSHSNPSLDSLFLTYLAEIYSLKHIFELSFDLMWKQNIRQNMNTSVNLRRTLLRSASYHPAAQFTLTQQ